MFAQDPPSITFTKDFQTLVHGVLLPGRTVTLVYDAERLPNERSQDQGQKAWTINAFYKFVEQGGEVHVTDLWSETGVVRTKLTDELGSGTMMICRISIPENADHLSVWFLNTGKSGAQFWDSNLGRNYIFRFVVEDFNVSSVAVVHDAKGPLSWFNIEVAALPEVSDLTVLYRIMNNPAADPEDKRLALTSAGPPDSDGRLKWSGSVPVPEDAVVRFSFAYNAYGNPHADSNSGRGYLTWSGAKQNPEAGVL